MVNTKLIKSPETLDCVLRRLAKNLLLGITRGTIVQVAGNRLATLGCLDILRAIGEIKVKTGEEKIAKASLLRACYRAEQSSALGSLAVLLDLVGAGIGSVSQYNREVLLEISAGFGYLDMGSHILEAIEMGGAQAVLSLKETDRDSFILVSDSIDIPVTGVAEFGSDILLSNCRFVAYDGVIERVSEINALLEASVGHDSPIAIYARGYGYEVVSTLLHNWRCKKLRVIPLTPSSDTHNFWFADLPFITSVEDIPFTVPTWDKLRSLNTVRITQGFASIQDETARELAAMRRKELGREAHEIGIEKSLIDDRAGRLSSRKVEVNLGRDMDEGAGISRDRVGSLLRLHMHARGDFVVTRSFGDKDFTIPLRSDTIGCDVSRSLVSELQTTTMVMHDV